MAQTGYTPIQLYYSTTASTAPTAGSLANGELAINITDGKLYYKDNAAAVQVIAWKTTPTSAGGTGLTSYTAGDLLYYATGTTLSKLAIGAANTVLTSSGTAPQWSSALTVTGLTDSGNLTFTGTSNRITGDFSNATLGSRVAFQSSTTDGNTNVGFFPNGTATSTRLNLLNSSSTTNYSLGSMLIGASDVRIVSDAAGSGTQLPLTIYVGGSEAARFVGGTGSDLQFLGIKTTTPACQLDVVGGIQTSRTGVTSPAATDGNIYSGTYTPTLTNTTNISASSAGVAQYMRVGNVVTVSGQVDIDPTVAGDTVMGVSVPVASNLAAQTNCGGTFAVLSGTVVQGGSIYADSVNDRATFRMSSTDLTSRSYQYHFTYRVI